MYCILPNPLKTTGQIPELVKGVTVGGCSNVQIIY
jgi:hypothetical protein